MTSYAARVLITNLLLSWGLFIQFFERKPAFPKYAKNTYRIRNVAIYKSYCSPGPHYARKIIVDTILFLRFCLRLRFVMQTEIFKNTFQTRGVSFTKTGSGSVDGKHFENGGFQKRWDHSNHVFLMSEFSSNTNPKYPVIVTFLNSSGAVRTGRGLRSYAVIGNM